STLLPPSSPCTGLPCSAQRAATAWPAAIEPVRLTRAIGAASINSPAVRLSPQTKLTTPGGNPASISAIEIRVASGDGFHTTVLPKNSAAAILLIARATGLFHGVIRPMQPTG